ncbi:TPA: 3'-5' exoribonuclease [Morganella morganii]|nr:3'-5' exoribonuclease [Morganella morganii]
MSEPQHRACLRFWPDIDCIATVVADVVSGNFSAASFFAVTVNRTGPHAVAQFGKVCQCCDTIHTPELNAIWGNGSNFDNVILRTAYENCAITPFWKHWNDRDVRTIVELGRNAGIDPKKDFPFVGEVRNALDDALHQVNYVVAIHQHLLKNF